MEQDRLTVFGCGYIGSRVAKYFKKKGYFVRTTTRSKEKTHALLEISDDVVQANGNNLSTVEAALKDTEILVVAIAPTEMRPKIYQDTYVTSAQNIAKAVEKTPSIQQIIYTSSCSVYGNRDGRLVKETEQIRSGSEKVKALIDAENILLALQKKNINVCVYRLGGIFGENRSLEDTARKLSGKTVPGSGDEVKPWIHQADVVNAIHFATQNELDGVFNLVNDSVYSNRELFNILYKRMHLSGVEWDWKKSGFSSLHAMVCNKKLKDLGFDFFYPSVV